MTASSTVDPSSEHRVPPGVWVGRTARGLSIAVRRRTAVTTVVLLVLATAASAVTVLTGTYHLSLSGTISTLLGGGDRTAHFIVVDQRLPRAAAALLVGSALGLSGAIFQSLSRNVLGSPDVVGFTTGASSGGLVVILVAGASSATSIALGTVAGGLATAFVVYLFSAGRGAGGQRLILVGISIGAMLASVNDYLITRADLAAAETAKAWQFGSLNLIPWSHVVPLAVALLVLLPAAAGQARSLHVLELGDDAAIGLGVPVARVRGWLLLVAVLLAASAVAAAGPISFLALAAPQLARRLARSPGAALMASTAMGALLLAAADLLSQRLLSPFQIPVGLVTGALGGAYLCWLIRSNGRRAGVSPGRR